MNGRHVPFQAIRQKPFRFQIKKYLKINLNYNFASLFINILPRLWSELHWSWIVPFHNLHTNKMLFLLNTYYERML